MQLELITAFEAATRKKSELAALFQTASRALARAERQRRIAVATIAAVRTALTLRH